MPPVCLLQPLAKFLLISMLFSFSTEKCIIQYISPLLDHILNYFVLYKSQIYPQGTQILYYLEHAAATVQTSKAIPTGGPE